MVNDHVRGAPAMWDWCSSWGLAPFPSETRRGRHEVLAHGHGQQWWVGVINGHHPWKCLLLYRSCLHLHSKLHISPSTSPNTINTPQPTSHISLIYIATTILYPKVISALANQMVQEPVLTFVTFNSIDSFLASVQFYFFYHYPKLISKTY